MPVYHCGRYVAGHDVHHIQAFRAMRGPGRDVTARVEGNRVIVTDRGVDAAWWNHDLPRLAATLEESGGAAVLRRHNALTVPHEGGAAYFYLAREPSTCELQADPDDLIARVLVDGGVVLRVDPGDLDR